MEELEEKIKNKYAWEDTEVLSHGRNYFFTASKIYESLESYDIYPLLTLLGLSAELFLKAFDVDVNEEYSDNYQRKGSMLRKKVKTLNNGKNGNQELKHNGHKLEKLFKYYSTHNKDLFEYLDISYDRHTERNLYEDLIKYSMIFEHSRYIFEHEEKKYINDIDIIFNLVKLLYDSITILYEDKGEGL